MKRSTSFLFMCVLLMACNSGNSPDVSHIKVSLTVDRFDKDFFEMDTLNVAASLNSLQQRYGNFLNDYLYKILMLSSQEDTVRKKVTLFIRQYKPIYDSVQQQFASTAAIEKDLKKGLQYLHYYFPDYKLPDRLITFVGPIEGYGNVLTEKGFAVGLQLYMGKDFSIYQNDYIRNVYPEYLSRRFEASYIPLNCMRNIVDDMYPYTSTSSTLIEQMVESGKRLYLLDQFLPETADSIKIGYTQQQLNGCYGNEAMIWNFFIKNDLLHSSDPSVIRDYIADGPKTDVLGDASPGSIGQFVGWQIVKKWMKVNNTTTLEQMMKTPAVRIHEEAKYKPR